MAKKAAARKAPMKLLANRKKVRFVDTDTSEAMKKSLGQVIKSIHTIATFNNDLSRDNLYQIASACIGSLQSSGASELLG